MTVIASSTSIITQHGNREKTRHHWPSTVIIRAFSPQHPVFSATSPQARLLKEASRNGSLIGKEKSL
ncbi:MAG TPA: hypothetical protein DEP42_06150 [Ruminococcaceae bacterium]|nr:hypothetical protein [Oscillospiraceae bacterium]